MMEKLKREIFLTLLTIIAGQCFGETINKNKSVPCEQIIPKECKVMSKVLNPFDRRIDMIVYCNNVFDQVTRQKKLIQAIEKCALENIFFDTVYFKPEFNRQIVDASYGVFNLKYNYESFGLITAHFINLKGFDIESMFDLDMNNLLPQDIFTDFNLYKHERIVRSCDDFNGSHSKGFIFRFLNDTYWQNFQIAKPKITYPICLLFFRNARIKYFKLSYMANSFYRKSVISFSGPRGPIDDSDLNSNISTVVFESSYDIDFDSSLLNPIIFAKMKYLKIHCHFRSIETNVFHLFKKAKYLSFDQKSLVRVIRKQGIEWIKRINTHIHIDYSRPLNESLATLNADDVIIILKLSIGNWFDNDDETTRFLNEDFCLFADYPFENFVFLKYSFDLDLYRLFISNNTPDNHFCTDVWLDRYYKKSLDFCNQQGSNMCNIQTITDLHTFSSNITNSASCNFQRRLELCNKSSLHLNYSKIKTKFSVQDFILIAEFLLIMATPLMSAFGIASNIITILVILHKKNMKTMRENHYYYMCLHCVCNSLICFIQIMSLFNECQLALNGFFCSSIRQFLFFQYLKIIFSYLDYTCRILSNFCYFGFSMCRLARIGKNHGKFIESFNKFGIIKFMAVSVLVSVAFSAGRAIAYKINLYAPLNSYPQTMLQTHVGALFKSLIRDASIILNCIYDIFNYLLFLIVHLAVDIVLIVKLRRVIAEKEEKMREMKSSEKEMAKSKKENKKSKHRAFMMVIFSSLLNLITKFPFVITTLNDVRLHFKMTGEQNFSKSHSIRKYLFRFNSEGLSFKKICGYQSSCLLIQSFGSFLYVFSLLTTLFFLKRFDKNFKIAYQTIFAAKKSPNSNPK